MRIPPYLKAGDKVGIVAPARKISREELSPAIALLQGWGLEVLEGKHLYGACHQFSGEDAERAQDLQAMLDDASIKAIFCARGGYGTLRIIEWLDFGAFVQHPKWIVGYSDATVLHSHVQANFNIASLHATMPIHFMKHPEATGSLRRALWGEKPSYSWSSHPLNRPGTAEGIVTGGNLSLLYALNGSPSDVDTRGKILFIEDLDEYLYHVDRMMLNLKRSGKLASLAGLIVGGMSDMKDNAVPYGQTAQEIIWDAVKTYSYPVCFDFPGGHIEKNLALVLGTRARLKVTSGNAGLDYSNFL